MAEVGYFLFFLTTWFIIPYVAGNWFFKKLKSRWKFFSNEKGTARIINYGVFLLCALFGWLLEMLVLTGIEMMLNKSV